jgi:hypothetical protein
MRRRALLFAATFVCAPGAVGTMAACSFVSTDGLTGGTVDAALADGSVPAADTSVPTDARDASDTNAPDSADAARDPSLIAEYSFEDPDGPTALDTSGKGKHATLVGGASFTAGGARGRGVAVHGADYVEVNALNGIEFPPSGTFSIWCRPTFPPNDTAQRNVLDGYAADRLHIFLRHVGTGTPGTLQAAFQLGDGSGQYAFVTSVTAPQNTWVHVVMTWDAKAGIGAVYANGALVIQSAYATLTTLPFAPTGQLFHLGEGFIGELDEVRVFNRPLPSDEARALD